MSTLLRAASPPTPSSAGACLRAQARRGRRDATPTPWVACLVLALWAALAGPSLPTDGGHRPAPATDADSQDRLVAADLLEPGVPRPHGPRAGSSGFSGALERDGPTHHDPAGGRSGQVVRGARGGAVHVLGTDRPLTLRDLSAAVHPDRVHAPPVSS